MNDYKPTKEGEFGLILAPIENSSKFVRCKLLQIKYAQKITDAFAQFIETSKRKTSLLETDDGK